jgi:archaellum component FlaC
MSTGAAQKKYPTVVFEFTSLRKLVGFLLTTQEDSAFRPGTAMFEKCLSQVHFQKSSGPYLIRVQADRGSIQRLTSMAQGLAKEVHQDGRMPGNPNCVPVSKLMERITLVPETHHVPHRHWIVALWGMDGEGMADACSMLWDLGARQLDVGAARSSGRKAAPTFLIRLHGLRDVAMLRGWVHSEKKAAELYAPYTDGQTSSRYYVLDGYEYPVPGLTRLANLDAEVCLLRPEGWLAFGMDQIDFFRRSHIAIDFEVELKQQTVTEVPRSEVTAVPLELELMPKPDAGKRSLWQVDQEIDRQRRALRDLEGLRASLLGRTRDDVHFAYRFDQPDSERLNPLLMRMMRNSLGVLSHYEYAFCRPQFGVPYHLIVSGRTQKQMGYSLQMADAVFYQPSDWRRWGVNLFLPLHTDLAPAVDTREAIPLLQQLLERSAAEYPDEEAEPDEVQDAQLWDAILWERGADQQIVETRVKKLTPLLEQFRLLNGFQPRVARDVEHNTRERLERALEETRRQVTDQLAEVERDLLGYVEERSQQVRAQYEEMDGQVRKAETLVEQMTPRVETVAGKLNKQPEDWTGFVRSVLEAHREVTREPLQNYEHLENLRGKFSAALLKTLTPRGRDLEEYCKSRQQQTGKLVETFETTQRSAAEKLKRLDELTGRMNRVIGEIQATQKTLAQRLNAIRKKQKQADQLQQEIETIDRREKEVNDRLERVSEWHAAAQQKQSRLDQQETSLRQQERAVAEQALRLRQLEEGLKQKLEQAVARLKRIERQMGTVRAQEEEVETTLRELETQVELLDAHEQAVAAWAKHYDDWNVTLERRHTELQEELQQRTNGEPPQDGPATNRR